MQVNKTPDTQTMIETCFGFQKHFFNAMEKQGYVPVHKDRFMVIESKLLENKIPMLKNTEAQMFAELVDATSMTLLNKDEYYMEDELEFLKEAQKFMKYYKGWIKENGIKP